MFRIQTALTLAGALVAATFAAAATPPAQPGTPILITVPVEDLAQCRDTLTSVLPAAAEAPRGAAGQVRPVARPPVRCVPG
ncbi:hypothetical protein [Mesobacterium pallidum]|uniref:hypothetical protein n=1 Tax=Mesobacterium pallidum TaxID=2872037 RepID=UPI001EE2D753|nr:hypothetical protein [Mesobacterium pallidum]